MIDLASISIKSTNPTKLGETLLEMGRIGFVVDQSYKVVWNRDMNVCDVVLMFRRRHNEREKRLKMLKAKFPEITFTTRCFE